MSGLSHITFMARDVDRATAMLERILEGRVVYRGNGASRSRETFLLVDDVWVAVVEGEGPASATYDHVAFHVEDDELDEREQRARDLGLTIEPSRPRGPGEARSVYIRDDDRHLIELHSGTLDERLAAHLAAHEEPSA